MYNALFLVIFLFFMLVLAFMFWQWEEERSMRLLNQWLHANGYKLLEANRQYLTFLTPFWLTSRGQTVYRVKAWDEQGNSVTGYALCGGRFMGLWSDRVEIKWDMPPNMKIKNDAEKPKNDFKKNDEEPILFR